MSSYITSKKTLKSNPSDPIIEELNRKVAEDKADKSACDLTYPHFETTLTISQYLGISQQMMQDLY